MDDTRPGEDAAWAAVVARWEDEAAHREYLARRADLEGLAEAGRRYKAALDARPADPVALRWRDEILRRAAALALSQIPRVQPPRELPSGARRAAVALAVVLSAAILGWALLRFPPPRALP